MSRLGRALVAVVTIPFLSGCYTVSQVPVPATHPEREAMQLQGVVVTPPDDGSEEVIRFAEVHEATWTPTSLSVVADVSAEGRTQTITRLFPITEIDGLMVRELDAGRVSLVIGAVVVGAIAVVTFLVTGKNDQYVR